MNNFHKNTVSLSASWFIRPGCEASAEKALMQLAIDIQQQEPDTLMYVIHTPFHAGIGLESLPPTTPLSVVFLKFIEIMMLFSITLMDQYLRNLWKIIRNFSWPLMANHLIL